MKVMTIPQLKQYLGITDIKLCKTSKSTTHLIHHDENKRFKISMDKNTDITKPLIAIRKKGRQGFTIFAIQEDIPDDLPI